MALTSWMSHEETRAKEVKRVLEREEKEPLYTKEDLINFVALISAHNIIANDPQLAPRYLATQEKEVTHFEDTLRLLGDVCLLEAGGMASQLVCEWMGIQQFPVATQTALHRILGKLKQESVDTLTILILGKGGVGKSSTVNSIVGERVAIVSAFQSEAMRPLICSRSRAGFTLNLIDTPGLIEGGFVNDHALDLIKRFLINKTVDILLYVDRLDGYRVDGLDLQVTKAISKSFGQQIWQRGIVVLTHAQLSPPDELRYADFVDRRSSILQAVVCKAAGFNKSEAQIPVVLVENSGRCNTNSGGEKVLSDGTVWLPNLVERIVEVATNGSQPILIDKKLIEGPDANQGGKRWIPFFLALQYFFIVKPIQRGIQKDIENEKSKRPSWEIYDETGNKTIFYSRR